MLVFKRRVGERIVLPTSQAAITVVGVTGKTVRLGITAPEDVAVERMEKLRRDRSHLAHPARPFDVAPPKTIRIVIADADDLLRQQYLELSTRGQFDVRVVTDGTNCVKELVEFRPHLVLLDSDLPSVPLAGANGDLRERRSPFRHHIQNWPTCGGVLQAMRERDDVPVTPVIIISTGPKQPTDDVGLPIIDHIQTPITTDQLQDGISALFAYRGWKTKLNEERHNNVTHTVVKPR